MIQDTSLALTASAPGTGVHVTSTNGLDLNPDFGSGPNARRSPLPGLGSGVLIRVDVTTAFAISAGEPVAQFHAVLSNLGDGVAVHTGASVISIGVQAPSLVDISGTTFSGMAVADLTLNSHFFIRLNPWTAGMGRNFADAVVVGQDLRYLGVMIAMPNYLEGGTGTHFFSAGAISAHLVKDGDVMEDPTDFMYPAGSLPVG